MSKLNNNLKKSLCGLMLGILSVGANNALAETSRERAMLNSDNILNSLHGVLAESLDNIMEKITARKIPRLAPELPVFIVEIIQGKVLLYEGQPSLVGQEARSILVDEKGTEFGQAAINLGKNSRSGWLNLELNNRIYYTFCSSRYPFVVCSVLQD